MRCWNGCAFFHIWSSIQSYCLSKQSIDTCFSPKSSFSHRVAPRPPAAAGKKITVLQVLVTTYLLHADVVEPDDKKIMFFELVNFSTLWLSYWHLASADFLTLLPSALGTSQFLSCRGFIAVRWLPNKPILCALVSEGRSFAKWIFWWQFPALIVTCSIGQEIPLSKDLRWLGEPRKPEL